MIASLCDSPESFELWMRRMGTRMKFIIFNIYFKVSKELFNFPGSFRLGSNGWELSRLEKEDEIKYFGLLFRAVIRLPVQ